MHAEAFGWVARQIAQLPPRRRMVELGGRNINGSIRQLFIGSTYTSVDIAPGPGVDVVADGASYQPEVQPDTVVTCETLEHAEAAEAIVRNAHAILQPGGVLILTCASTGRPPHSGIDGGPVRQGEYYANVSPVELETWLSDFASRVVEYDATRGDVYALAIKEA